MPDALRERVFTSRVATQASNRTTFLQRCWWPGLGCLWRREHDAQIHTTANAIEAVAGKGQQRPFVPEQQAEYVEHGTPTLLVTVGDCTCRRNHSWPSAVMITQRDHWETSRNGARFSPRVLNPQHLLGVPIPANGAVFARYGFVGYAVWYARPDTSGASNPVRKTRITRTGERAHSARLAGATHDAPATGRLLP